MNSFPASEGLFIKANTVAHKINPEFDNLALWAEQP